MHLWANFFRPVWLLAALNLSLLIYLYARAVPKQQEPSQPVQPEKNSKEFINTARMADLAENLGDALTEVIESYLENTPILLSEIREAHAAGDHEALGRAAHSLKSSSAIFGAEKMVELCRKLEFGDKTGRVRTEMIEEITFVYEKVKAVLNLYLH
jgi:histidine phosphotransfer protein HptB